jgi:hypothetical protein
MKQIQKSRSKSVYFQNQLILEISKTINTKKTTQQRIELNIDIQNF